MTLIIISIAVVCLAYANGANDNFKGVATLFGCGTTNYRRALAWATTTTFFGSLTAVMLTGRSYKSFSGKGLVADELVASAEYGAAMALGAGLTVLSATHIGTPISTTHGLVTPTAARSTTWRTSNYHDQYLPTSKTNQASPGTPVWSHILAHKIGPSANSHRHVR